MIIDDSVYGKIEFSKAIEKIIHTKPLQRLKQIHQNGAVFLAYPDISTSRFEHSLGVCHLIGILGVSQKEQIAGLLHDLSHTAFSHVIDYVLEDGNENFHEHHKLRFLLDPELGEILHSLELAPEQFLDDRQFSLLETELPKLCADRIDYTLRDLIVWGKVSQPDARAFINSLEVKDGTIVINSLAQGHWFKNNYEYLNQYFFRDPKNAIANSAFSKLLQEALKIKVLQLEDFFQNDDFIIERINSHPMLKKRLKSIEVELRELEAGQDITDVVKFKLREVDPLIVRDGNVTPLSMLLL